MGLLHFAYQQLSAKKKKNNIHVILIKWQGMQGAAL
jgi:hypothetical protein